MPAVGVNPGMELKLRRISLGIRQYELAARLGIAQPRLSEVEAGRRRLLPHQEQELRRLLGMRGDHPPAGE